MSKKLKIVDEDVLKKLSDLQEPGAPDFLTELIVLFIDATERDLTVLQTALKKKDSNAITGIAHKLKSSCANLGLEILSNFCIQLENAEKEHLTLESAIVKHIFSEFENAKNVLNQKKVA